MPHSVQKKRLTADATHHMLKTYQSKDTWFSTPKHALLAQGQLAVLPSCEITQLASTAMALLAETKRTKQAEPILLGAIPFSSDVPSHLYIPAQIQRCDIAIVHSDNTTYSSPLKTTKNQHIKTCPAPDTYLQNVRAALVQIALGSFDKVVLSRSLELTGSISLPALLNHLWQRNSSSYTFAINLAPSQHSESTLIGASPELLIARHGRQVKSHPLAGSIPRSLNPQEDQLRAETLLHSAKDLHEHAFVVDAVADVLRAYCHHLVVPKQPTLIATPTMWHLGTVIEGELIDTSVNSLALALALHPTPAVCGHPQKEARQFIESIEGFDRDFFAGLCGWCNAHGDGEWAVTIRCATVTAQGATLYAGAGIVTGSEPQLELAETEAKLGTMLEAITINSSSSLEVERESERADWTNNSAKKQYDLHSIVPENQHSGADHDGMLSLYRFEGSDIPVRQETTQ